MKSALIHEIISGNPSAFKTLYEQYVDYALRTAIAITKNTSDGADAVQETFIRVYNNIEKYDINKPFKPWFYRILINECNRILKKNSNDKKIELNLVNNMKLKEDSGIDFKSYKNLYDVISKLKDIYRIPIILKYLNHMTEKEIANILDVNINTLKSRLLKGRSLIGKEIQDEYREFR